MANNILTINMITREAVRLWKNTNAFMQAIDTQYDDQFAIQGAKIGQALRIRLPNDYTVRQGPAMSIQDTQETNVTLTLATQSGVDVSFNSVERTMSMDDYSERVLAPMVNKLAGSVALNIMQGVEGGISNFTANQDGSGPPGNILTPVATTYLNAGAVLDSNSAPTGRRRVVNDPFTDARMTASLMGLLNPAPEISRQYANGEMKRGLGFMWMKDQTVLKHTTGSATTATVAGAGQSGTTLLINALSGTLAVGDIITIAAVNGVNRITDQSFGTLQQFVLTAAAANGATQLSIYPAIVAPIGGQAVQYQTVDAAPANLATITPVAPASTTFRKNFVFAPEAVTMATADLLMPNRVEEKAREQFDGVSMRMLTDYIIGTDQLATRLDVLFGYLWVRPEWACVVADAV